MRLCEEQRDEAIQRKFAVKGFLDCFAHARNDGKALFSVYLGPNVVTVKWRRISTARFSISRSPRFVR